ncbi:MAG: hypothetical protein IPH64_18465 [Comamonadaceae bacterium]|nr:hypothetical protein [Comamonadaceae bacterium]
MPDRRAQVQPAVQDRHQHCAGLARLYDLIDRNPLFVFQPIDVVCNPATIAAQHKMVSIGQAFAIDLTGQACVDQFDGEFYGGIGARRSS